MRSVLIAGGAGFIGSHLCEALLRAGYNVICIDNLCTSNIENIKELLANNSFKFIEQDITKPININQRFSIVLHLASPASPKDFRELPIETLLANSIGTYNLLELSKRHNAKFILASSSEVYGDPEVHPQHEGYYGKVNPVGKRSCYGEGKRFAEALTMQYYIKYKLPASIIRLFNTYGPRMRYNDGRVIPNFIQQALSNQPITIYGSGSQTRSFCYVDDIIEGFMKVIQNEEAAEVINLGNPEEYTIIELANIIKELTNSTSEITFMPLPDEDDPRRRQPDISKAKRILNWQPKVNLKEGLLKTIQWFKEAVLPKVR